MTAEKVSNRLKLFKLWSDNNTILHYIILFSSFLNYKKLVCILSIYLYNNIELKMNSFSKITTIFYTNSI